ncbi:expressed protein [Echinococcus multilocularis]|uniref:Expressed protein n=1 Tax=Echinococcus multilocularis TaxID=6211 RepID=A0A068YK92_ECHMU|nr:expressed protein [Echinococcus multilocularis]
MVGDNVVHIGEEHVYVHLTDVPESGTAWEEVETADIGSDEASGTTPPVGPLSSDVPESGTAWEEVETADIGSDEASGTTPPVGPLSSGE